MRGQANSDWYKNDDGTVVAVHSGYYATPKPWCCQIVEDRGPFRDGTLCTSNGDFERRFASPEAAIKAGEAELAKRRKARHDRHD